MLKKELQKINDELGNRIYDRNKRITLLEGSLSEAKEKLSDEQDRTARVQRKLDALRNKNKAVQLAIEGYVQSITQTPECGCHSSQTYQSPEQKFLRYIQNELGYGFTEEHCEGPDMMLNRSRF